MCPWPRIQGAMFDHDSLLISYRGWRGEPRGAHKIGQTWEGRGDCIDCGQCIAVCPTGIDIRNGAQLECIQCALCIDACNEIMDKVERPRGLIAYDTIRNLETAPRGKPEMKFMRPRVLLYAGAFALVASIMVTAWTMRPDLEVSILHDRNPLYVKLSDGGIRNGYTIKVLNKLYEPHVFHLGVDGIPGAALTIVGHEKESEPAVTVAPDELQSLRVYVTLDKANAAQLHDGVGDLSLVVTDTKTGESVRHGFNFRGAPE
jgi:cytochrome c oxidase accessory protein FixG